MSKIWLYATGTIGGAVLGFCALKFGFSKGHISIPPTVQTSVEIPAKPRGDLLTLPERGFIGVISTGEWIELEPKVVGRLERVLVKPGDRVERGAVLAEIDHSAQVADVRVAGVELGEAVRQLRRRQPLARGDVPFISAEEIAAAKFAVTRANAQYSRLRRAVNETKIIAPSAGVVSDIYLAAGATGGPGKPIMRLIAEGTPEVRFALPVEDAKKVSVGTTLRVKIAEKDISVEASVSSVNPEIDSASQMIFATAKLRVSRNEAKELANGLMARLFVGMDVPSKRENVQAWADVR